MSGKSYEECKRFVVYGLIGLAVGSVLLFARKIPAVPEVLADLSVVAGGCIVLCSNSCIIYGLLIFVGSRGSE
ncbi:MAG: hypothetical protein FWH34_05165 [Desulfovibrionaceae bacterium]|nr:hypothetical protein [Desulfovibrionaceae bacterium]